MKQVYMVAKVQEFDTYEKMFFTYKFKEHKTLYYDINYILSDNADMAVEKYKTLSNHSSPYKIKKENETTMMGTYKYKNIVEKGIGTCESHQLSINMLKELLTSEDFLEYCRERLMPIETFNTVINEK